MAKPGRYLAALTGLSSIGDLWSDPVDAIITPDADGTRDFGLTGTRFAVGYFDDIDITTSITVGGTIDVIHTATEADDHAVEVNVNAAGFGDVRAVEIQYTTGALGAGQEEAVHLININESASTGGSIHAYEVLATEGSATVGALKVGPTIDVIDQQSGTFGDMDSFLINAVDDLTDALSAAVADVPFFLADNDTITIGDAATYQDIEFILSTASSNPGIKPTFEFWNGSAWVGFTPIDGTDGFRFSGIVSWDLADISTWAVDGNTEFVIRITRTQKNLNTVPVGSQIQISAATVYGWDKSGVLTVASVVVSGTVLDGTADTLLVFTPLSNEPPAANAATIDLRNLHPVLDFNDTTNESAVFSAMMPRAYLATTGVTVRIGYSLTSATSGDTDWDAAFERIGDSVLDVDGDSFAAANSVNTTTVPGTSGHVDVVSITFTAGADMDSVVAGDLFRIKITRDAANDSAVGDAELHFVEIQNT